MIDIKDLIKWFIRNDNTLGTIGLDEKIKLQKLLYYSQAMHYAVYGTPLFYEKIEAWWHGPVVPAAYYAHEYTDLILNAQNKSEELTQLIDPKVETILKVVNYVYGSKTGKELEELSHSEEPWAKLKEDVKARLNPEITKDEIKSYYAPLKDIFEAFFEFDFENEKTVKINSNNFTFNSKEIDLTDDDLQNLWGIGENYCQKSFLISKASDGSLEG